MQTLDQFFMNSKINYKGNYILQTARANKGKHVPVLELYYSMTSKWIKEAEIAFNVAQIDDR